MLCSEFAQGAQDADEAADIMVGKTYETRTIQTHLRNLFRVLQRPHRRSRYMYKDPVLRSKAGLTSPPRLCTLTLKMGARGRATTSENTFRAPERKLWTAARTAGSRSLKTSNTMQPLLAASSNAFSSNLGHSSEYTMSAARMTLAPTHDSGILSVQSHRSTLTPRRELSRALSAAKRKARSFLSVHTTCAPRAAATRPAQAVPQPSSNTRVCSVAQLPSSEGSATSRAARTSDASYRTPGMPIEGSW
mmetsp:Transcript_56148/g.161136  ORF Transcript_56148/g.161136 Transcript_56148/m.161136 type:complete len:248 (+) Transcript_56148:253-996(+)